MSGYMLKNCHQLAEFISAKIFILYKIARINQTIVKSIYVSNYISHRKDNDISVEKMNSFGRFAGDQKCGHEFTR